MPPARTAQVRPGLDIEQLGKMTAPFTVHVTRVRGSQRELVILPAREGAEAENPSGGWTVADVTTIDTEIAERAGGGHFEIQIRDSSAEPLTQRYMTHIPTEMYPPMAPKPPFPGPFDGSIPVAPGNAWGSWAQPGYNGWGGWGTGARTPVAPATATDETARLRDQLHQQQLAAQAERFEYTRRLDAAAQGPRDDGRLEREREERQRAEREAERERARAEAAAVEARHRAELEGLKAMVTQLAQTVTQAQHAPKTDEVAMLRAEMERRDQQARADAAIAEANRRAEALAAEMRQLTMQLNQRPTGPDPTMMVMIEMMKASAEAARATAQAQAEATREAARLQTEAAREEARARAEEARVASESQTRMLDIVTRATSAGNIPPVELIRMMREAGQGAESAMRTVMGTTTELLDLHRNATANLLSMQPQGEGVGGRIVSAIENGIHTFSESQQKAAAAHAAAQASVARSQADALMAQAAIAQGGGLNGPPAGAQPVPGAPPPTPWSPGPSAQPVVTFTPNPYAPPATTPLPAPAAPEAPTAAPLPSAPPAAPALRHGKTDQDWFGVALPKVLELRAEAATYLTAVEAAEADLDQQLHEPIVPIVTEHGRPVLDKHGKPKHLGASPFVAADFIVKAVGQIAQAQAAGQLQPGSIPAFELLFAQQAYPALVDCILPDAPAQFRAEVVRYLWRHLNGQPVHDDNDPPLYGIEPFLKGLEEAEQQEQEQPPVAQPAGVKPNGTPANTPARSGGGRPRGTARA